MAFHLPTGRAVIVGDETFFVPKLGCRSNQGDFLDGKVLDHLAVGRCVFPTPGEHKVCDDISDIRPGQVP